jgi:dimethylaniline monooxygenase (N-oxide forming)
MQAYMEIFTDKFLKDYIKYNTEVLRVSRESEDELPWMVEVLDKLSGERMTYRYARIVLCTGVCLIFLYNNGLPPFTILQGCSEPYIPPALSPRSAQLGQLNIPVLHSESFASEIENIVSTAKSVSQDKTVVIIGGGKSAQEYASKFRCTRLFQLTYPCCVVLPRTWHGKAFASN